MKAIETSYKGYRFRSRLEARWAVFFDALGAKWEYEREGYHLPSGDYLPDFFLYFRDDDHDACCYSGAGCWFEIKPLPPFPEERQLLRELAAATMHTSHMLCGVPNRATVYSAHRNCGTWSEPFCPWTMYRFATNNVHPERAVIAAMGARFEHGESPQIVSSTLGRRPRFESSR